MLQVIARSASSIAQLRERPAGADLVAKYWLLPDTPAMVRLPMSTTLEPRSMAGANSLSNSDGA